MIRNIVFDMGGVLIRFDRLFRIYAPAFIKECQQLYIRLFSEDPTAELVALA